MIFIVDAFFLFLLCAQKKKKQKEKAPAAVPELNFSLFP
jgi:hypothetical protein